MKRPGLQAALTACRSGEVGGIVVAKLDRLSRSVIHFGHLLEEASKKKFNVVALDLGLDLSTPRGELLGLEDYIRPCRDLRHSSITNAAAAAMPPGALMSRSGHSSYTTTQRYVDLAGERFREEGDRLERRLWGDPGTKMRYQVGAQPSAQEDRRRSETAWLSRYSGREPP
jgi:integrase